MRNAESDYYGNLKHCYRHCFLRFLKVKGKSKNSSAALCRTIYWILKNVQKQAIQQNKGLTFMEF